MRADHGADVLCVRQVQRSVDLIENVHGRRLEQQHGEDEREREQRALTAREVRQRLLPDAVEGNFDLETVEHSAALGRRELGRNAGQERLEDGAKVPVDLLPRAAQRLVLLIVELGDDVLIRGYEGGGGTEARGEARVRERERRRRVNEAAAATAVSCVLRILSCQRQRAPRSSPCHSQ